MIIDIFSDIILFYDKYPIKLATAKGLQACMDNFQPGLISDLLGENHEKWALQEEDLYER